MRHFQNCVLDYKLALHAGSEYVSPPLETAWATEAIFFTRMEETEGAFRFQPRAQISVNGIDWIDEGTCFPVIISAGQFFIRLKHFGGWLRLAGRFDGERASAFITTNLVLKE